MATTTRKYPKYDVKNAMYAYVGAGQLIMDKAKELPVKARDMRVKAFDWNAWGKEFGKFYGELVGRGEKTVKSIRKSAYTERAVEQARAARVQVKAATTSVRKAVGSSAEATKVAAKKVS